MAAPFRNIFEALANRTVMMMDLEKAHRPAPGDSGPSSSLEMSLFPPNSMEGSPELEGADADLMQWMSSVTEGVVSEDFHDLLSSMASDVAFRG